METQRACSGISEQAFEPGFEDPFHMNSTSLAEFALSSYFVTTYTALRTNPVDIASLQRGVTFAANIIKILEGNDVTEKRQRLLYFEVKSGVLYKKLLGMEK